MADGGRSARSNASGRYEALSRHALGDDDADGCVQYSTPDEAQHPPKLPDGLPDGSPDAPPRAPSIRTDVTFEAPRTIINYLDSPFVGFDRSINMYRGCEHGCIYCFARPTHAYYGLSPGLDFETRLFAKPNAAALLERELSAKSYKPRHIAIGTNTDPYQPIERKLRLTRSVIGVLKKFNHPVSLLTKSHLITRDIDLLSEMAAAGTVRAMLSITTLDPMLARRMEPRAASPRRRLDAVRALKEAGIPVGVMTAPIIPGLNDHEIESLLDAVKAAGADYAGYTIIRLPLEVAGLFREWLDSAYPERAGKVMRFIRELNGGQDYNARVSRARKGEENAGGVRLVSPIARLIEQRFDRACRSLGLARTMPPLDPALFSRPLETDNQLSLFR